MKRLCKCDYSLVEIAITYIAAVPIGKLLNSGYVWRMVVEDTRWPLAEGVRSGR
jgi:hypothetical protein